MFRRCRKHDSEFTCQRPLLLHLLFKQFPQYPLCSSVNFKLNRRRSLSTSTVRAILGHLVLPLVLSLRHPHLCPPLPRSSVQRTRLRAVPPSTCCPIKRSHDRSLYLRSCQTAVSIEARRIFVSSIPPPDVLAAFEASGAFEGCKHPFGLLNPPQKV